MSSRDLDRNLKTTFDAVATEYDAIRPSYPDAAISSILNYSDVNMDSRILEIACGTGQATQKFLARGLGVHAIDIGPELLAVAKSKFQENANASFENVAFEDLKAAPGSFDLIYCATAFHWLDPETRFEKAAQLLRAGGTLAIFSNRDLREKSPLRTEMDKVYEAVDPSEPTDGERQTIFEKATKAYKTQMEESGLFADIEVQPHVWEETYSLANYLRLLDTFSYHRNLSPEKREQLYAGICEIVEDYGGNITIKYLTEVNLGRKR